MRLYNLYFAIFSLLSFTIHLCQCCPMGYYGSSCIACPVSTYKDFTGSGSCKLCPSYSFHQIRGSTTIRDCQCLVGYAGAPEYGQACHIRSCEPLIAPANGRIVGECNTQYQSVCVFQCNIGYYLGGSAERACVVTPGNVMDWTGYTPYCEVVRCPVLVVVNADPEIGQCSSFPPVPGIRCSYSCRYGYRLVGSEERECQLDGTWSGASTTCEVITCPPLQPGKYALPQRPECTLLHLRANSVCFFSCPSGYYVEGYDITRVGVEYYCSINGTWSEPVHDCLDYQPPILTCPFDIVTNNIKGKAVAEVMWNIEATDNSLFDPSNKLTLTSNYESPHNFTIGHHFVKVEAKDSAGQTSHCSFNVIVEDVEAPTCSFCPADRILEVEKHQERVEWDPPSCVDNSGQAPLIKSSRVSGDLFSAPGVYDVQYHVSDDNGNVYTGCSFRISLKRKTCSLYPPPENGVLACHEVGADKMCVVMCKNPYDFTFNPPTVYICLSPNWLSFGLPGAPYEEKTPWPDCAITGSKTWIRSQASWIGPYFFDGDANNTNVQQTLRSNTITILKKPFILPFCAHRPDCTEANINLYIGKGA